MPRRRRTPTPARPLPVRVAKRPKKIALSACSLPSVALWRAHTSETQRGGDGNAEQQQREEEDGDAARAGPQPDEARQAERRVQDAEQERGVLDDRGAHRL